MKPIEGYPDYYVTEDGQVISHKGKKPRALKPGAHNNGSQIYHSVTLRKDNKSHQKLVHRLVAEAYIPNPGNKSQVNHKDRNPTNNNVENLEWTTPQENSSHANAKWHDLENILTGEKVQVLNLHKWAEENGVWDTTLHNGLIAKGWKLC
jgi:hypothetical protein